MTLEAMLVEAFVIEGAERSRQAAQRPDETKLRGDEIDFKTELDGGRKRKILFGFQLHVRERISRRE
jgi:hypothetical protein